MWKQKYLLSVELLMVYPCWFALRQWWAQTSWLVFVVFILFCIDSFVTGDRWQPCLWCCWDRLQHSWLSFHDFQMLIFLLFFTNRAWKLLFLKTFILLSKLMFGARVIKTAGTRSCCIWELLTLKGLRPYAFPCSLATATNVRARFYRLHKMEMINMDGRHTSCSA